MHRRCRCAALHCTLHATPQGKAQPVEKDIDKRLSVHQRLQVPSSLRCPLHSPHTEEPWQLRKPDSGLMQLALVWGVVSSNSTHAGKLGAVVPDQWRARGKGL